MYCNPQIEVLKMLEHPNIIKYYDSYIEKQRVCIVMDYAEGGNFNFYIRGSTKAIKKMQVGGKIAFKNRYSELLYLTLLSN